jgi:hypothetical protein
VLFTYSYHKMAVAKSPLMLLLTATFMMWIILWNFTTGYKQSMYWVWMSFFFFVCTVSSGRTILPADPAVVGEIPEEDHSDHKIACECK